MFYPEYCCNEELQGDIMDPVWDMHSLAYSLLVIAGGTLPWNGMQSSDAILQVRSNYQHRELVYEYAQYLDAVLCEWISQALKLTPGTPIRYQLFLDYLWTE